MLKRRQALGRVVVLGLPLILIAAGPLRAFFEIELPLIRQGITGAALFSLILSFNETIRTSLVQGGRNTIATYIWAQHRQVGLAPNLYALMTVLIVTTLVLLTTPHLRTQGQEQYGV